MEALGAVSSVFAVLSLALQVGSNIQKLIEFWDSVKEAPDEIAQVKVQLHVLGELLICIEADIKYSRDGEATAIGEQCLQICHFSIMKLAKASTELDRSLNGSGVRRRWTCLRKAFREQQLTSCWHEIERAKSMLIIYQGWKNGHV